MIDECYAEIYHSSTFNEEFDLEISLIYKKENSYENSIEVFFVRSFRFFA